MTRWRRSLMSLTTPLLSCQTTLKVFWSQCWRNLQKRWWMMPQSPSPMRRAQPASQSQAAPPPVWCMDPTTTSTKVGHSLCVTAAPAETSWRWFSTETLKDVLRVWPSTSVGNLFVKVFPCVPPPADDCQQMFLHPVNVRCLLREYGSLEASPDTITATVVEIVGHTVTEVSNGHSQFFLNWFSIEQKAAVCSCITGSSVFLPLWGSVVWRHVAKDWSRNILLY